MWSLVSFWWLWFSVSLPSDGEGYEAYGSFLMGETDWEGDWVLFWCVWPCSVNLKSTFLLMGGAVFPPCYLTWGQTMVKVMKIIVTHSCTARLSAPNPAAGHRWPTPLLETPGHSWASLSQSLMGSLLLSPRSWCTQGSVCALQDSFPSLV